MLRQYFPQNKFPLAAIQEGIQFLELIEEKENKEKYATINDQFISSEQGQLLSILVKFAALYDTYAACETLFKNKKPTFVSPYALALCGARYLYDCATIFSKNDERINFYEYLPAADARKLFYLLSGLGINVELPISALKKSLQQEEKLAKNKQLFLLGKYDPNSTLFQFFSQGGDDITKTKIFPMLNEIMKDKHRHNG